MENKYEYTLIYKISCKDLAITDCYIGHTTDFKSRYIQHKSNSKNEKNRYNLKVYKFIRSNGGWGNFEMDIIEHYPCENKDEAIIKEQEYITILNATLNTYSAKCDLELRQKKHNVQQKERIKIPKVKADKHVQEKAYRDSDEGKEKRAIWVAENREKLLKDKKDYYNNNKEHYATLKAENYQKNKEIISQQRKVLYTCGCGKEVQVCQKARHEQSVFHIKNV